MGDFIKLSSSTKAHLMTPKLTNMWQHVRVDYITADNAPEMVKLGRLLDVGKTADLDGPALGKKTNGCVNHHLDKLLAFLAQHPECLELMEKLRSVATTLHKCSLSCDHLEECVYLHEAWSQVWKWAADKKVHDMN